MAEPKAQSHTGTSLAFNEDHLEKALAVLGYPGFAYLARYVKFEGDSRRALDPTELIRWAVAQDVLDVRLIEGLPWLLAAYATKINWGQLISDAQKQDAQNRLGYLAHLAIELVETKPSLSRPEARRLLKQSLLQLQEIRSFQEQTLMEEWSGPTMRVWLQTNRPQEAAEWHMLTTLTINDLQHAE